MIASSRFNLDPTVGNTRRMSFKTGTKFIPTRAAIKSSLPPPISGMRDDRFMRPGFRKESPKPRGLQSIAEIERLKTRQQGIKVRLGETSLGKIKVKKKDRFGNDILDAAGQPVFEEVELNFGLLAQMLQGSFKENMDKLVELETAIRTGATSSEADREAFAVSLARMMGDQQNIARVNERQLDFITRSLRLLGISRDPVQAGIQDLVDGRFVTGDTWEIRGGRNKGPIILFLIANVRDKPGLSPNTPIFGRPDRRFEGQRAPMQLISIFSSMAGSSRAAPLVMDLIDKTMHNNLRDARRSSSVIVRPRDVVPVGDSLAAPVGRRAQVSGISLEEEDATGAFRLLQSIPEDVFGRLEGENIMQRLARQSTEEELAQMQQLVPFDPTRSESELRQQILARSAAATTEQSVIPAQLAAQAAARTVTHLPEL